MEERVYNPQFYPDEDLKCKSGIYQIRNLVNDKIYIGSTENLLIRKKYHFYTLKKLIHRNNKLQNSYNKYGKENFIFEVIEFVEDTDKLLEIEQYWIDKLNIVEKGYNIQPIAGKIHITDEIRKKMSGKIPWNKGKTGIYTQETLQKMKDNAYSKSGEENPFYGKRHTEETKQKISEANSVKVIRLRDLQIFEGVKKCAKENNMCRRQIAQHCLNRLKTKPQEFMYYTDYLKLTPQQIQEKLNF